MKLLALELSSSLGSIAWREAGAVRFTAEFANDRQHSGLFFTTLQRCIAECGRPERIAVGLGPGSYAGTRIAIAAAVGLQAASGAELVGLPSICALPTDAVVYAVIGDARRQSFFLAQVEARRLLEPPELMTDADLRIRLSSLAVPLFTTEPLPAFAQAQVLQPSALVLAEMAATYTPDTTTAPLEPIYLREPHITRPKIASL
ncbi:MAG TPA: tRNA (adenosine(37)-N6)-threonylcarbamoyltransferase complex dimerization subunit type 1 TsaB [Chthoniobacterales bacterium]